MNNLTSNRVELVSKVLSKFVILSSILQEVHLEDCNWGSKEGPKGVQDIGLSEIGFCNIFYLLICIKSPFPPGSN